MCNARRWRRYWFDRCRFTVAVPELGGELEDCLLAIAVGAGLQVLGTVMEIEVTTLAGRGQAEPGWVVGKTTGHTRLY